MGGKERETGCGSGLDSTGRFWGVSIFVDCVVISKKLLHHSLKSLRTSRMCVARRTNDRATTAASVCITLDDADVTSPGGADFSGSSKTRIYPIS